MYRLYGKLLKWSFILIIMYISHTSEYKKYSTYIQYRHTYIQYIHVYLYNYVHICLYKYTCMYCMYVCMYCCSSYVEKRISLTPIR